MTNYFKKDVDSNYEINIENTDKKTNMNETNRKSVQFMDTQTKS